MLRCNQCDDAPCVEICPTGALFKRADGIVDFDNSVCIGCKSCMQGCPYDALYIEPESGTAAKCHYCAHRTDKGLEPACVIVCPTQAIIPGDLDDPTSRIARIVAREQVSVRKPEQGTKPKVYYKGADAASLAPSIERSTGDFTFAQRPEEAQSGGAVREVYDVPHEKPWGWKVWTYLFTKSIAAGVVMVATLLSLLTPSDGLRFGIAPPLIGLIFIAVTSLLLIFDLKRPERFYLLMTHPNFSSWLVWGGFILTGFGGLCALWGAAHVLHWPILGALTWPGLLLGAAAAVYTAFLFWQCEGRDFWQSPMLLPDLLAQATIAGSAALILVAWPTLCFDLTRVLAASIGAHALFVTIELIHLHGNVDTRRAGGWMTAQPRFWFGSVVIGGVLPLGCLALMAMKGPSAYFAIPASAAALYGLFNYEMMWIKAGQEVPLS